MRGDLALMRTLSCMTELIARLGEEQQTQIISSLLLALKVPTDLVGYDYLLWAVQLYGENPTQGITKELYPSVAAKYGRQVTSGKVEKGIRDVIDHAFRDCDEETWKLFFPAPGNIWARPSNTEFISRIYRLLELWLSSRERNVG